MESRSDTRSDDLETRLRRHSAVFTSMIQLIPARYYHKPEEKEEEEEEEPHPSKFFRNKRNRAPKQAVKEAIKRAKRLKLDPFVHERVKKCDKSNNGPDEDKVESEEAGTVESEGEPNGYRGSSGDHHNFSVEYVKSTSLPELRERLRKKIAELRSRRKAPPGRDSVENPTDCKDDQPHEQRRKRKEKRKIRINQTNVSQAPSRESERPSIEDKGHLVFSKFDFSVPLTDREQTTKKKDYKKLLARAEAKQKKLEELTEQDLRKGRELHEQLKWQHALGQAAGKKMKDNPALLQKTLKRIDKRKAKSRKEWKQRADREQRKIEKRQEIRQKHIEERIEQKKAKAVGRKRGGKGKRRSRKPGF